MPERADAAQSARRVRVDTPGEAKVQERIKRRDLTKLRGLVGFLKGKLDDRDEKIEQLELLVGLYSQESDAATMVRVEQAYHRILNAAVSQGPATPCLCGNGSEWRKVYLEPWQRPFRWVWACVDCGRRSDA